MVSDLGLVARAGGGVGWVQNLQVTPVFEEGVN